MSAQFCFQITLHNRKLRDNHLLIIFIESLRKVMINFSLKQNFLMVMEKFIKSNFNYLLSCLHKMQFYHSAMIPLIIFFIILKRHCGHNERNKTSDSRSSWMWAVRNCSCLSRWLPFQGTVCWAGILDWETSQRIL